MIRMWVLNRKAINLVHKLQLLEALILTLNRKHPSDETLEAAFGKVILTASRVGCFQDAGLAAALAATSFKKTSTRLRYASLAQACYVKWGAGGVVKHLLSTQSLHREANEFISSQDRSGGSIHMRSKERFSFSPIYEQIQK